MNEELQTFFVGVKGVIVRDGKILLLKKRGKRVFWDIPGGRITRGETAEQTIIRELREELPSAGNVTIDRLLHAHVLDRNIKDDISLALLFYKAEVQFNGEVTISDEHSDYKWMTFSEAREEGSEGVIGVVNALEGAQ